MKSIWYFVGLLLMAMGSAIALSGLYSLVYPPARRPILSELHLDLWWGIFMAAFGALLFSLNRKTGG